MRRPQHHAKPQRTQADRELDLVQFVTMARPAVIAAATADELAGRYRVPLKIAQYRLHMAQQRAQA